MGELEQAIERAVKKLFGGAQVKQVLAGIAKNVGERTCSVERDGSPTLLGVRLSAIDDSLNSYFTVYPAEGSTVLVAIIENMKTEAVVISCSEIEMIKLKAGERTLVMNSNGFVFDGTNLIEWMQKVANDLQTLKGLLQNSPVTGNGAPLAIVFNPTTQM